MRVVIYGLSKTTFFVEKALRWEHTILCYSDGIAHMTKYKNVAFVPADKLCELDFDYIIIAVDNRSTSEKIKKELENIYGISAEKIVDCRQILNGQKVDNIMKFSTTEYSGIILGNSHVAKGVNPKYLVGPWCNLAISSEDIYYHLVTLKICRERYWERIKKLKYLIIDMWDYEVFNYDASMTKSIPIYWSHGGIFEDIHNYDFNIKYSVSPDEMMKEYGHYAPNVSGEDWALANELFDFSVVKEKYDDLFRGSSYTFYNDYPSLCKFGKNLDLPDNLYMEKAEHKYEDTIQENIKAFDELIGLAKEINKNIKIIILLTPRLFEVEKAHSESKKMMQWRREFEEIIFPYISDNVRYLNMKSLHSISKNAYFYEDAGHMNAVGANAYTSCLNDYILNWES